MDNPDDVSTSVDGKTTVIKGKSDKDVCIKASQTLILGDDQACFLESNGGTGFMASGSAEYQAKSNNPDNIRKSRRLAYQKAYMRALDEAANFLGTVSVERMQILASSNIDLIDDERTLSEGEELSADEIKQVASASLKGLTLWEISDDGKGKVSVTVCLHPKVFSATGGKGFFREGKNFGQSIDEVYAEILKGVVAPTGGRTITGPGGELCWIAFGSAVVLENSSGAMTRMAEKKAKVRAQANLVSMLTGQNVTSTTKMFDASVTSEANFDLVEDDSGKTEARLKELVTTVSSVSKIATEITAITKGVLPRGVQVKTFTNPDLGWVYAIILYSPELTAKSKEILENMNSLELTPEHRGDNESPKPEDDGKDEYDSDNPGPSGRVDE
jgi:hypothetical protein